MISGNKNTNHVRNFWFRQTIYRIIIIIIIIMIIIIMIIIIMIIIIMIMIRRRRRRRIKKVKAISLKPNRSVYETFSLFVCWKQMVYHSFVLSVWIHGFSFFFFFFFARRGCQGSISSFTFLFFKVNLPIHITFCTS